MADQFWLNLKRDDGYECPWCQRNLKVKVSNSAKNPARSFVSCSKDFGGCGLFSFMDARPDDRFKPGAERPTKKGKTDGISGGTQVLGGIAAPPEAGAQRLAELTTEVAGFRSDLAKIMDFIKQVTDN